MQSYSIQIRTAVQMVIDFLLEHREQLEREMRISRPESAPNGNELIMQKKTGSQVPAEDATRD